MNNSQTKNYFSNDSSLQLLKTGIPQTLEQHESLLLKLFQELRTAGMALTLEQYDLLQIAVAKGYGLSGWEDLKRLCRLLWVKPCPNYDINIFNRVFDAYRQQHSAEPIATFPPETPKKPSTRKKKLLNLPEIPPRNFAKPLTPQPDKAEIPVAVNSPSFSEPIKDNKQGIVLTPQDFPIKLQDIQSIKHLLKKPIRVTGDLELDIEATIEKIGREGISADVEMRSRMSRSGELLLLIDDSLAMIPFFRAFEPFMQAITQSQITPAQIYRFTSYPDEHLYGWEVPTIAHPLRNILPKLHRYRTITLIISDAGAATFTYNQNRIKGILKFLIALSPCIRQLIWLNPLPHQRWKYTSAWGVNGILNGKMLTYEPASLQTAAKENLQGDIQIWQINPHQK